MTALTFLNICTRCHKKRKNLVLILLGGKLVTKDGYSGVYLCPACMGELIKFIDSNDD